MPQEQESKSASLRWCQHGSTDSEVALTASEMVGVTQLHPVTAYGCLPKSALVMGSQMSQSGGLFSGRLPPIYKNAVRLAILPQFLYFLAQKWLGWWAEKGTPRLIFGCSLQYLQIKSVLASFAFLGNSAINISAFPLISCVCYAPR